MHANTPIVLAHDPRMLGVRTTAYLRSEEDATPEACITQQVFDVAARPIQCRDPRLFAAAQTDVATPFNLSQVLSLSGVPLLSESVDAGWQAALHAEAGQTLEQWDGRDTHTAFEYDTLLRLDSVREQMAGELAHVTERFSYATCDEDAALHNRSGQVLRHDDPAGTRWYHEFSIAGGVRMVEQRFLQSTDPVNWPEDEALRDSLLESAPGAISTAVFDAMGAPCRQDDAQGNARVQTRGVDGALKSASLQLVDQPRQVLISEIRFNAFGQVESERLGNGVVITNQYLDETGWLGQRMAVDAQGGVIQDLNYQHDPMGHVLRFTDAAQAVRYYGNQRIEPTSTYVYDSLYQLIAATGRESITTTDSPDLPEFESPIDPKALATYSQTYQYDSAGNLLKMVHVGAQNYTRAMEVAPLSNRSLPVSKKALDTRSVDEGFDANGNLLQLHRGQQLHWNARNQLRRVTLIQREAGEEDYELYRYDASGMRQRKVRVTQAAAVTHRAEVRYLPGLEVRTDTATGETLHILSLEAGSSTVRVLHWVAGRPGDIANDQVRYTLCDLLGSGTQELDSQANLISQESYYPFGGTSWWAGRNALEAKYKTIRYSGKERDACGLYYYGLRYYAPWLCRWINPDPAGVAYGLNGYAMVGNQPISRADTLGLAPVELNDTLKHLAKKTALKLYSTEDSVSPFWRHEVALSTQSWMRDQIRAIKSESTGKPLSATKYGAAVWGYAQEHFFPLQKSLAEDRAGMTPSEKEGFHLFWATNAGARYINGVARSVFADDAAPSMPLKTAVKDALGELSSNNGEYTLKLSHQRRTGKFDPAMNMLKKYEKHPEEMLRLFTASLGDSMQGMLYRGARVKSAYDFKVGDVVRTSGFTSFSPHESTARRFMTNFHDDDFRASTDPVLFSVGGGARKITALTEVEGLVAPNTNFSIVSTKLTRAGHYEMALRRVTNQPAQHWI
ncbi:RHS repeat-associated core domain-containing protein [Xanthomonas sp. WHRI 1810A]|uniref:RHS repeat domain-containing protein n=1 Tax=Xanthomonas sp. WHRI 1810A TaxID=3161565 RepID=UPI0032E86326